MSIVIVIPARLGSTRLPEKALLAETGWPLVRHIYEQAKKSQRAQRVLVATDSTKIEEEVKKFGGECVLTDPSHPTGTDRLAEVAERYLPEATMVVNVQGDEPEVEPAAIDSLIDLFSYSHAELGTLVTPFSASAHEGPGSPLDPNAVKCVLGAPIKKPGEETILGFEALYFSRSLIPYPRDTGVQSLGETTRGIQDPSQYYLHLGMYAYRPDFLKQYVKLPQRTLEKTEKLEQLRVLEHGYKVVAGIVPNAVAGIDTRADYDAFITRWKKRKGEEA